MNNVACCTERIPSVNQIHYSLFTIHLAYMVDEGGNDCFSINVIEGSKSPPNN